MSINTGRSFAEEQTCEETPISRAESLAMQLLRADGWNKSVLAMTFQCSEQVVNRHAKPTLDDVPLYQAVQAVEADLKDGGRR